MKATYTLTGLTAAVIVMSYWSRINQENSDLWQHHVLTALVAAVLAGVFAILESRKN